MLQSISTCQGKIFVKFNFRNPSWNVKKSGEICHITPNIFFSQNIYNLAREGDRFSLSCAFSDQRAFSECAWSHNNQSVAGVKGSYGWRYNFKTKYNWMFEKILSFFIEQYNNIKCSENESFNVSKISIFLGGLWAI